MTSESGESWLVVDRVFEKLSRPGKAELKGG